MPYCTMEYFDLSGWTTSSRLLPGERRRGSGLRYQLPAEGTDQSKPKQQASLWSRSLVWSVLFLRLKTRVKPTPSPQNTVSTNQVNPVMHPQLKGQHSLSTVTLKDRHSHQRQHRNQLCGSRGLQISTGKLGREVTGATGILETQNKTENAKKKNPKN